MRPELVIFQDLGMMDYKSAWDYQENLLQANVRVKSEIRELQAELSNQSLRAAHPQLQSQCLPGPGDETNFEITTRNYLLFVEHPPVFTLGKNGNTNNILLSEERLNQMGIAFFRTNRGGDITFHGPQQIVGYPILDLEKFDTDIGHYLRNLEEVIILTLEDYGLQGGRSKGETGVWMDPQVKGNERKICAIGVRCSRWITMHGFAFNVNTDLNYFNAIIPCGIPDKQVTSLKKELGREIDLDEVKQKVRNNFERVFNVQLVSGD